MNETISITPRPAHQQAIDRFFRLGVRCAVCDGTRWEAGPEVLAPFVEWSGDYDVLAGPFRVFASFVCRKCSHTLFIHTGSVPYQEPGAVARATAVDQDLTEAGEEAG